MNPQSLISFSEDESTTLDWVQLIVPTELGKKASYCCPVSDSGPETTPRPLRSPSRLPLLGEEFNHDTCSLEWHKFCIVNYLMRPFRADVVYKVRIKCTRGNNAGQLLCMWDSAVIVFGA